MTARLQSDQAYQVDVRCPACGLPGQVPVALTTMLKRTKEKSQLSVVLGQEAASHSCGQLSIVDADQGEIQW